MVGTRRSLASANPFADDNGAHSNDAASPSATEMSKKAQSALRKLQIDDKGATLGEKPEKRGQLETYHWRGAVYAVSKDTKLEWLEAQPERYRRRSAREKESVDVEEVDSGYGRSSEDVASRTATPVGSVRRVRFDGRGGGT